MAINNYFFVIQSSKENERIKRNISSSKNALSKETKRSAKENGSFTSPSNTSNKQNVTLEKVKIKFKKLNFSYHILNILKWQQCKSLV